MAYTKEQWKDARGYYEAGLSLSKIVIKTGIGKTTISQKAKREQWEHGANTDYIEAKEIIVSKKGTISEQSLVIADEIAHENVRFKNLINGNAEKLASKLALMADSIEDAQDIRHLVEANDKLSITLKVNERHAPKIDVTQQLGIQTVSRTINVNPSKKK